MAIKGSIRGKRKIGRRPRLSIGRILIVCLLAVTAAFGFSFFLKQEAEMKRLFEMKSTLNQRLEAVRQEEAELTELQSLAGTPAYIEKVARDQLGMIRPDEVVFHD